MFVKICGTTNLPDAELALRCGADALGFIFAPSKRQVTAEQAAAITAQLRGKLPGEVDLVGIFTVADAEDIAQTVTAAGLTAVQMHFPYDAAFVGVLRELVGDGVRLYQVVGFPVEAESGAAVREAAAATLAAVLRDERLAVVLLDAVRDGRSGGMGEAFAWAEAAEAVQRARAAVDSTGEGTGEGTGAALPNLMVAGGLTAENVGAAVRALAPWGVDVVSGVEASPGRKSPERLAAFVRAADASDASPATRCR